MTIAASRPFLRGRLRSHGTATMGSEFVRVNAEFLTKKHPVVGPSYSQAQVCAASALLDKGVDTFLDALGAIPVEGSLLKGIQFAGAVGSAGIAVFGSNNTAGEGSTAAGGLGLALVERYGPKLVMSGFEVVPVAGNFLSGYALKNDIQEMGSSYDNCMKEEGK